MPICVIYTLSTSGFFKPVPQEGRLVCLEKKTQTQTMTAFHFVIATKFARLATMSNEIKFLHSRSPICSPFHDVTTNVSNVVRGDIKNISDTRFSG